MEAIRDRCPEVLTEFAKEVQHPATTPGYRTLPPQPGRVNVRVATVVPSTELRAWATRWHLRSTVIYRWASHTVEGWERDPQWRTDLRWELPPDRFRWNWSGHTSENLEDQLAPVGAMPEAETLDEFKARAASHWESRVNELVRQGFNVAMVKTNLEHFEWFARFQCGGESLSAIARGIYQKCHLNIVKEPVTRLAKLLQLSLRPRSKGGRLPTVKPRD
jgi:hypothetical protein